MSQESDTSSVQSNSDTETNDKSQALVPYSKKSIFLYDKKCRTVLQLGVLYKNLSKAATNAINLDKITHKIQSMINKNQIYLRDVGPVILGITKIVVKKTFFLFKDIEELTNLRINSKDQSKLIGRTNAKDSEDNSEIKERKKNDISINGKKSRMEEEINEKKQKVLEDNEIEINIDSLENTQDEERKDKENEYNDFEGDKIEEEININSQSSNYNNVKSNRNFYSQINNYLITSQESEKKFINLKLINLNLLEKLIK